MKRIFVTCLTAPLLLSALPAQEKSFDPAGELEAKIAEIGKEKGKGDAALVKPLTDLGWLHLTGSRYPQATDAFVRAWRIARATSDVENFSVIGGLEQLSEKLYGGGDYAGAGALLRELLELAKRYKGAEHAELATSFNNIAFALDDQGKYAEAGALNLDSLAFQKKSLGVEHPLVATALDNLAANLLKLGSYLRFMGEYPKSEVALARRSPWPRSYKALGDDAKAGEYAKRAEAIREKAEKN